MGRAFREAEPTNPAQRLIDQLLVQLRPNLTDL